MIASNTIQAVRRRAGTLLALGIITALLLPAGCSGDGEQTALPTTPIPSDSYNFSTGPRTAATTGAAPETPAPPADAIESLLGAYDVNLHLAQLTELASDKYQGRRTGSPGAEAAAAYVQAQFANLGLIPWAEVSPGSLLQHFSAAGLESDNVIGVLPGSVPGAGFVILAAHYDHLGLNSSGQAYNGADDDAAGVAALIETARILTQQKLTPRRTIVFCAFSGEEEGSYGAEALGSAISEAGLTDDVEMINIDGIGATGGDYFGVWDEGAAAAAPLVNILQQAGAYLGTPVVAEGTDIGSDAQPFNWQFGIAAVTVDWSWGSDPSVFHPYYHSIYDDVSAIDPTVLERATKVAILGAWLRASQ